MLEEHRAPSAARPSPATAASDAVPEDGGLVDVIDLPSEGAAATSHDDRTRAEHANLAEESEDTPGPGVYGFPRGLRPFREAASVVGLVAVAVTVVYRLWQLHPNIPSAYDGDGLVNDMIAKAVREHGWFLHNGRLGAPFGGTLFDFPQGGENIHFLSLKVLGWFLPSYGSTINAYFLLTFVLVALSAYFVARYLKLGIAASTVIALLYTFAPFHLAHGEWHVQRSGYYIVPVAALVVLWLVDYRTRFFSGGALRTSVSVRRWRWLFAVVVGLVLGGSDTQNSIFAVCLLGTIGVVLAVSDRDGRPLAVAAVLITAIGGSLLVNNAPSVLYRHEHGANTVAAVRSVSEGDEFSLSVTRMLLPIDGHRVPALAKIGAHARTNSTIQGDPGEPLGAVGAVGLVVGLVITFGRMFGRQREPSLRSARWRSRYEPLVGRFGALSLISVLFAATGGFSYLLAVFGFTLLRTWVRFVLYILFFALLIVGVLLNDWFQRVRRRRNGRIGVVLIALLLIAFGVFDQTSPTLIPNYRAIAKKYDIDNAFFTTLENRLPKGAMVFEYPIIRFPEAPLIPGIMNDYEQLIGYLHTKSLRWSYGGMKGRPESDWQTLLPVLPIKTQLAGLAAAGFRGVYINRDGYVGDASNFEGGVEQVLGPAAVTSTDQRLVYYDLGPMRRLVTMAMTPSERQAFAQDIVRPVMPAFDGGFYREEAGNGHGWRWSRRTSELTLHNFSSHYRRVTLAGSIAGNGVLTLSARSHTERVTLSSSGVPWQETFTVPPGDTRLRLRFDGAQFPHPSDARDLYFKVQDLTARGPGLERALCAFEPAGSMPLPTCPS